MAKRIVDQYDHLWEFGKHHGWNMIRVPACDDEWEAGGDINGYYADTWEEALHILWDAGYIGDNRYNFELAKIKMKEFKDTE